MKKNVLLAKMQEEIKAGLYSARVYSYGTWSAGLIVCVELSVVIDGKKITRYPLFSARGYGKMYDEPREYNGRILDKHWPYYDRVLNIIHDGETLSRYIRF